MHAVAELLRYTVDTALTRAQAAAVHPETLYARSKDGDLAYQAVGNGPLDLVFIPSWLNNVEAMWEEPSLARFLHRLGTFSRLLCFDKRVLPGVPGTCRLFAVDG